MTCRFQTFGAMTATLDGTSWVPVMTRASALGGSNISLEASDCTHWLRIEIRRFHGLGTYHIAAGGDVSVNLQCDGPLRCQRWSAGAGYNDLGLPTVDGSGSLTVTTYTERTQDDGSGKIEGTFSFSLVPVKVTGATGTRVITNGRFGSAFSGLYIPDPT